MTTNTTPPQTASTKAEAHAPVHEANSEKSLTDPTGSADVGIDAPPELDPSILKIIINHIHSQMTSCGTTPYEKACLKIRLGKLLIEQRRYFPHGDWVFWLTGMPFSVSTAYGYMRLAKWAMGHEENRANSQ